MGSEMCIRDSLEADQYQEYSNNSFEVRKLKNIGIENINHRVKINFSSEYGIQLKANSAGGIHVQLKIPAIKEDEQYEKSIHS